MRYHPQLQPPMCSTKASDSENKNLLGGRGENLEYGQLVKVDEKGIYLEVEKVNEPRE